MDKSVKEREKFMMNAAPGNSTISDRTQVLMVTMNKSNTRRIYKAWKGRGGKEEMKRKDWKGVSWEGDGEKICYRNKFMIPIALYGATDQHFHDNRSNDGRICTWLYGRKMIGRNLTDLSRERWTSKASDLSVDRE